MIEQLSLFPSNKYAVSKIDIAYKFKGNVMDRPKITSSKDAYEIFKQEWNDDHLDLMEEGKVLYLNRGNRVLSLFEHSRGGITGTVIDPRHVIVAALQQNACNIILAHNHPSGNLTPSTADENLTRKVYQACKFLDITLMEHIIVSRDSYYSFADNGLIY